MVSSGQALQQQQKSRCSNEQLFWPSLARCQVRVVVIGRGKMEIVPTESFVTPLKGFLILPPATQQKKSNAVYSKLDDKPLRYVIGTLQRVNKKISHFEMGLKRCDSGDLVIEEVGLKRYPTHRGSGRGSMGSREKERDRKVMQKTDMHVCDMDALQQGKITPKKVVTEKDKLVELYQYPGFSKHELTPLPNGINLKDVVDKVVKAQSKRPIGKTSCAVKKLYKFINTPCTQAILLDSFWWLFLHLYHPNREIQGHLFERIADNYSCILQGCHRGSSQENILQFFPSLLSQTVYTCFCSCFPRSWFNTQEFKAELCDTFSEWLGDTRVSFGNFESTHSDHLQKKPLSFREAVNKLHRRFWAPASKKKHQLQPSKIEKQPSFQQPKSDEQNISWSKAQRSCKKMKLKIAPRHRESHPACRGPEFTWHHFNINGYSPLVLHSLQKQQIEPKAGTDFFIHRRDICKPIPDSAQTYAELVKQGFQNLHQRRKDYDVAFWRHWREMMDFDQEFKEFQEFCKQEMQEELVKRKTQKQNYYPPLFPDELDVSDVM